MAGEHDRMATGRTRRAVKATTALAPSTTRFFTSLAASLARSPERTAEILEQRHVEIADHAAAVLGDLRGGAMKIGQMASFIDVDFLPPEYREIYRERLGDLRDSAPPMTFEKVRSVLDSEWDDPLAEIFAEFDQVPAAAASIGQVHRATLHDGRQVAVKVQYPEIADALEADVGTAAFFIRLAQAFAPGLDPKVVAVELRERVLEELDYELEATNQQAFARRYRGHPFIYVPEVVGALSRRRVFVSDWVDGERFDATLARPQEERDRFGEIIFRFFYGSMHHLRRFQTDAHPGNYLLMEDGRVAFLDFGSVKRVSRETMALGVRALMALRERDVDAYLDLVDQLGYVRRRERINAELLMDQSMQIAGWYLRDENLQINGEMVGEAIARLSDPREVARLVRDVAIPADELMARRVETGVVAVLGRLRAQRNWYRIAREYWFADPPATGLGAQEWEFFGPPEPLLARAA